MSVFEEKRGWNGSLTAFLLAVLAMVAVLGQPESLNAQSMVYGIDNERDSVAFAAFSRRMDSIREHRPTVAVVLSGGGAKGAAQIEVLRAIDSMGIPVDLVVGTSIGGLLGGLYACGYSGTELKEIMRSIDWDYLLRDTHPRAYDNIGKKTYDHQFALSFPVGRLDSAEKAGEFRLGKRGGIVHGQNIYNLFGSLLVGYEDECNFLELPVPFACVAADMVTAQPKVWHCGKLVDALRSTMSVPGLFTPVRQNGMLLMDGGLMCNFPANVAHRLGADIIIGIDITGDALEADEINSMIDIVFQTTDVLGRKSYDEALDLIDIYVHPDITGFNLLSFDSESIDTLLERGRLAAQRCIPQLDSLRAVVGTASISRGKRAINTMKRPVSVREVLLPDATEQEKTYVRKLTNIKDSVDRTTLDNAVAALMGTEAYETVTYSLTGTEEPYTLCFDRRRASAVKLGVSARYDNSDYASLLLHAGLHANRVTGWRFDAGARLGLNSRMSLAAVYRTSSVVEFGSELSALAVHNGFFRASDYNFRINFLQGRADLFMSLKPTRTMTMRYGVWFDAFYLRSVLADYTLSDMTVINLNPSNVYATAYVSLAADSFDDYYFPTRGMSYLFDYQYHAIGLLHDITPFGSFYGKLKVALSGSHLTFLPFAEIRLQNRQSMPYVNILSLPHAHHILEHQVSFAGITQPTAALNSIESAGLEVQWKMSGNHYLTGTAQYLRASEKVLDAGEHHIGIAAGYAYRSIAGPLRAELCWSDLKGALGLLVSLGLDF